MEDHSDDEKQLCGFRESDIRAVIPISHLDERDEEWRSPIEKILKLSYDHESWQNAQEILEPSSPECKKVADEARSILARHIIDRLKEEDLLSRIHKIAPRLRSAVELLSKSDADYLYPPFQFVVNDMREKFPQVYKSVTSNVELRIPHEMHPSPVVVSLAKSTIENDDGEMEITWGKFVTLLGLSGALAMDSVKSDYPDGVVDIIETFGLITEQVMGEWILAPNGGGGWDGFIQLNVYQAFLSPIPRTIVIVVGGTLLLMFISWTLTQLLYFCIGSFVQYGATTNRAIISPDSYSKKQH